jgi:hypothetical protein
MARAVEANQVDAVGADEKITAENRMAGRYTAIQLSVRAEFLWK